ncbi:MAG: hypothetical protein ACUVRC_07590, partial [Desulfotomaculales bacterium]
MDLDDPEFATILGSNLLWVQITAPDGRVLNRSHALQGDVRTPAYLGPAVQGRLGDQDVILVGGQLADGVRLQVIRPLEREEKFLATLTRVFILVAMAGLVAGLVGGGARHGAARGPGGSPPPHGGPRRGWPTPPRVSGRWPHEPAATRLAGEIRRWGAGKA